MPKKFHEALIRAAKKKYGTSTSPAAKCYIYGALHASKDKAPKKRKKK